MEFHAAARADGEEGDRANNLCAPHVIAAMQQVYVYASGHANAKRRCAKAVEVTEEREASVRTEIVFGHAWLWGSSLGAELSR